MAEVLSRQVLSELIGSIYDCALDPQRWESTLLTLSVAFQSQIAMIGLANAAEERILIDRTVGWDSDWKGQLPKYGPELHRMRDAFAGHLSLDEPKILSLYVPDDYQQTSPYFQEYLKPQRIADVSQWDILETPTHLSSFLIGRNYDQGVISPREIELGGLLLPHLRRAVIISKVLDVQTIERARMAATLDSLRCSVILTDPLSNILHANRAAERMLSEGALVRDLKGALQAKLPSAAKEMHSAIMSAGHDEANLGKAGLAIRLTEPDAKPVFAHVLPMTGSEFRTSIWPQSVAAVFIAATSERQDTAATMGLAYGLTPAELRLLANLLAGSTLAEAATGLGIAVTTARTHLDNIFLKTGVSRQSELMRLAMSLASPVERNP